MIDHHWFISSWANWSAGENLFRVIEEQRRKDGHRLSHTKKSETAPIQGISKLIRPDMAHLYRVPLGEGQRYKTRPGSGHMQPDVEGAEFIGTLFWKRRTFRKYRYELEKALKNGEEEHVLDVLHRTL